MKRHKLWLCDSLCSYRVFWQHGRLNSEPRDPRPRLAPASSNLCQASCQITQAAAVTAQRLLYSHPSLLQSCNYFRQNRTLERWAAHFKGQEFRQSTPTLSDTAGVTRGISLALVFMYIPQNLSCSPIFSPFSAPSLFIFPILLGVSLTYFLLQSWTFVFFRSLIKLYAGKCFRHRSHPKGNKHHPHGMYICERWGGDRIKE